MKSTDIKRKTQDKCCFLECLPSTCTADRFWQRPSCWQHGGTSICLWLPVTGRSWRRESIYFPLLKATLQKKKTLIDPNVSWICSYCEVSFCLAAPYRSSMVSVENMYVKRWRWREHPKFGLFSNESVFMHLLACSGKVIALLPPVN